MANPEVDRLIQELSQILNTNREKRAASEAMVQGIQQGAAQAQARRMAAEESNARDFANPETSYGGDRGASPYSMKNSPSPSAKSLSPSTTREGRVSIGQRYAASRSPVGQAASGVKLEDNAAPYEFLSEREQAAPTMSPADAAILEERKKRMTQNLMLSRGMSGGPLGGAGSAPQDPNAGLDPAVVDAVSRSGGPVGQMQPGVAPQVQAGALPAGWSPEDYARLSALSQRFPG